MGTGAALLPLPRVPGAGPSAEAVALGPLLRAGSSQGWEPSVPQPSGRQLRAAELTPVLAANAGAAREAPELSPVRVCERSGCKGLGLFTPLI